MEIEVFQGKVEEVQLQAQQDGEEYKKQSDVLQLTVEVQRGTQKVMNTALDVLREFYREKVAAALQSEGEGSPTHPASRYAKLAEFGGVKDMIQQIVMDVKALEFEVTLLRTDQEVKTVGHCHGVTKGSQSEAGEASLCACNKLTSFASSHETGLTGEKCRGCDDLRRTLRDKQDEMMELIATLCYEIDGFKAAGSSQSGQRTGKKKHR